LGSWFWRFQATVLGFIDLGPWWAEHHGVRSLWQRLLSSWQTGSGDTTPTLVGFLLLPLYSICAPSQWEGYHILGGFPSPQSSFLLEIPSHGCALFVSQSSFIQTRLITDVSLFISALLRNAYFYLLKVVFIQVLVIVKIQVKKKFSS
jgi:hypothetical protein